ncbi:fungal-specific transcription factor domain-containing protein [Mycena sp. CBHHK59/15]|nr:fungal-specific transcription factor domain-containing protein [Mycena sp. CBHHK59/15]
MVANEDCSRYQRSTNRRIDRACDICRRRKTRCNGCKSTGKKCSTCLDSGLECTYLEGSTRRAPSKSYVETLEARLEEADNLIRELRAAANAPSQSKTAYGPQDSHLQLLHDLEYAEMAKRFKSLTVGPAPEPRFMGKSSGALLIHAALDLKGQDTDAPPPFASRRPQFWTYKPWEDTTPSTRTYSFPSADLTMTLIDLYFKHTNIYLPLLHRLTFESAFVSGLHLSNDGFARTLLLVCAIASRYHTPPPGRSTLSCGWEWFDQVPHAENHIFGQPTLYDLQYYCLATMFLEGSSQPQACWTLVGMGLRVAQDVGAHRRKHYVERPSIDAESWKRAFYVLVYMDRTLSSGMGRPCAIQYDDFDIDPPIECDDEYWEDPVHPFEQPAGIPSKVIFFNCALRLNHILAFSLKILYSLNKTKVVFAIEDTWEDQYVAELDSALNKWLDGVPEHLRWDPERTDPVFFDQSVALYCGFYHLQILIHRPFIPMVRKSAPTGLPSLAICTNAGRACANLVDVQRRRRGKFPVVINLAPVFMSGIVLLLNVWSGKRTGTMPDPSREMANVHKCMEVVRLCEERWQSAGLLWDILAELASVGQLPLPNHASPSPSGANHTYTNHDWTNWTEGSTRHSTATPNFATDAELSALYAASSQLGEPLDLSTFTPSATNTWHPSVSQFPRVHAPDEMMNLIDSDTIAMWTTAPVGFEANDWGTYFSNFSEITQGQQHSDASLNQIDGQ